LLLVDKKPTGLKGELSATLDFLKKNLPKSKRVLLLRDILDTPKKTIDEWCQWGYYRAIRAFYDKVLIVGMQTVFDLVQQYRLPLSIARDVHYCGYIQKEADNRQRVDLRSQLGIKQTEQLVLVTPGGGEDGYSLVHSYLQGLKELQDSTSSHRKTFRSLVLCGPEMPHEKRLGLQQLAAGCPDVFFQSFTNDFLSYLKAADTVVSMGGYNTLTETLSLGKKVVVIPRTTPSEEQLIRATLFAQQGWVKMIHPAQVTGQSLMQAVMEQLTNLSSPTGIDFNGLNQVAQYLERLLLPIQHSELLISAVSSMCLVS
jgi:predicted glycosyltransferase